jgi:hypothetical protein
MKTMISCVDHSDEHLVEAPKNFKKLAVGDYIESPDFITKELGEDIKYIQVLRRVYNDKATVLTLQCSTHRALKGLF